MESAVKRTLAPGVELTYVYSSKFKTNCLSISLLSRLNARDAAKNALLPMVLRRGTAVHPDMSSISALLDELYGARIEPLVRRKGEVQCVGLYSVFLDDAYAPGEKLLERVGALMGEMLHSPATRSGILLQEYVEGERANLIDLINAELNDKRQYAVSRMTKLMCEGEAYSVGRLGSLETAEKIFARGLTNHYKRLIRSCPIEVFYCGAAPMERVSACVIDIVRGLHRADADIAETPVTRVVRTADEPRYFTEQMDLTQAKLVLGLRTGVTAEDSAYPALLLLDEILGGSGNSKLFMNVRERLSLCYYAYSGIEKHKGIMLIASGIAAEKYDEALGEILAQLEACKNGDISEDEFASAKSCVINALKTRTDSLPSLEDFWLGQSISGLEYGPEELAELLMAVSPGQVIEAANGLSLDAVYLLSGKE